MEKENKVFRKIVSVPVETKSGAVKSWRFRLRALNSIFIVTSAIVLTATSIALYLAPSCGVARNTGWTLAGLSKDDWSNLHVIFGFAIALPIMYHIYLNWKAIRAYLRQKLAAAWTLRIEAVIASMITLALFLMTLSAPAAASNIAGWGRSFTVQELQSSVNSSLSQTKQAETSATTEKRQGIGQGQGAGGQGGG